MPAQPMSRIGNQRGTALVAALSIAMILLPLGAFVALQCHSDLAIQRNLRVEIETFYAAEAGLEHALAEIQPEVSFDSLLAGPDGVAGTGDDGTFPFADAASGGALPLRYAVRATATSDGLLHIVSHGIGRDGATKDVEALVARSRTPFTPAAFYTEDDLTSLDLGNAGFQLSGLDHRQSDSPSVATGTEAAVAAVGSPSADAEAALRRRLAAWGPGQLVGSGGPYSIATTPFDLQRLTSSLPTQPQAVTLAPGEPGAGVVGAQDAPQLTIVPGDLAISGKLTGGGILVVRGTLHVTGTFAFEGLVLAMGGVVFEPSSSVTISGALWRTASTDARLELRGDGAIAYSATALATVDRTFPNLLPHAAVVVGWQEDL